MRIYLKYNEILENGQNLLEISKEYDDVINNIRLIYENIQKVWVSDNKETEDKKMEKLNQSLTYNNNYYNLFAKVIKQVNEEFLLTEQDATEYLQFDNLDEVKKYGAM